MKGTKKSLIYSQYEINTILFFATMILFIPLILVFTYIFDIDQKVDINIFILVTIIVNFILIVFGIVYLLLRKDHLKRVVKPTYRNEFIYLVITSLFGVLGFVVFYDYLGGNRDYIANILVFIGAGLVYIMLLLGRKFFKYDYMKKK